MDFIHNVKLKFSGKEAAAQGDKVKKAFIGIKDAIGGTIAAVGAVSFANATREALSYADAIGKTADNIGITTDYLQEMRAAGELTGVAMEKVDQSLFAFARRVGEAAQGQGEFVTAAENIGLTLREQDGTLKSTEQLIGEIADKIQAATTEQEKLYIASRAFGEEGAKLVRTLANGSAGLDQMRESARAAGLVLDQDLIRKSENLNDQMSITFKSIGNSLKEGLIDSATRWLPEFLDLLNNGYYAIEVATNSMVFAVKKSTLEIADGLPNVGNKLREFYIGFLEVVKQVSESMDIFGLVAASGFNEQLSKTQELLNKMATPSDTYKESVAQLTEEYTKANDEAEERRAGLEKELELLRANSAAQGEVNEKLQANVDLSKGWKEAQDASLEVMGYLNPAAAEYIATITRFSELLQSGKISQDQFNQIVEVAVKRMDEAGEKVVDFSEQLKTAIADSAGDMAQSFVDFAFESENTFGDMVKNMIKQIVKLYIQLQIIKPLMDSMGFTAGAGAVTASAKGNVFSGGNVVPFAKGGVVNGPQFFPMSNGNTGLMGEAGPEAIMPLKRNRNGDLGVSVEGGMGSQVVNVNVEVKNESSTAQVSTKQSPDGKNLQIIIQDMVNAGLGSGAFDKSLAGNFGVNRRGV